MASIKPSQMIQANGAEVGWDQVYSGRMRRRRRKHFAAGLYCIVQVHGSRKVNCQGLDVLEMKSYWIR